MRGKAIIPLALGLVVGLVALKLGVDAVRQAQGSQTSTPEVNVVVATMDIGPTMAITPDTVVIKRTVPTPLMPVDAFTELEAVVGRVTNKTIPMGTPLSPSLLAPEGTLPGLGVKIEEGYRAVSVKIDEVSGVAYQLMPGSFVDVLVVMDVKRGKRKETMSRVILQNAQIAAVGQLLGDPGETKSGKGGGKNAKSVTLLLQAEDVPKLHLAQTKGRITLAMRGGEDELLVGDSEAWEGVLLGAKPPETAETPDTTGGSDTPPAAVAFDMFADARPVEDPPYTVTVINGPLGSDAAGQVIRVTYANSQSMDVVEVGKGRTSGDDDSMQFGAGAPQGGYRPASLFGDRDRELRRRGARSSDTTQDDEDDSSKEIGE